MVAEFRLLVDEENSDFNDRFRRHDLRSVPIIIDPSKSSHELLVRAFRNLRVVQAACKLLVRFRKTHKPEGNQKLERELFPSSLLVGNRLARLCVICTTSLLV